MNKLLVALSLVAGLAGGGTQPQPPEQAKPARESDPAAYRARLGRMLEEGQRRQDLVMAALKRLDAGEPTEQVQRDMEAGMRPRSGDRGRDGFRGPARDGSPGKMQDGRGGREGGGRPPIDREAILGFLDEHNPELAKRIRDALAKNAEDGERLIGRLGPHIQEVLTERDPETKELRIAELKNGWEILGNMRKLGEANRAGDAAAKEQAVGRLRGLMGTTFDLRVRLHEREIAMLEQRLAKLRQDLSEERGGREAFITKRIEQMLNWDGRRGDDKSKNEGAGKGDKKP